MKRGDLILDNINSHEQFTLEEHLEIRAQFFGRGSQDNVCDAVY